MSYSDDQYGRGGGPGDPRPATGPDQWLGRTDPVETFGQTLDQALRSLSIELAGLRAERDGMRLELEGLRTQLELTQQRLADRDHFTSTVRELSDIVQRLTLPPRWAGDPGPQVAPVVPPPPPPPPPPTTTWTPPDTLWSPPAETLGAAAATFAAPAQPVVPPPPPAPEPVLPPPAETAWTVPVVPVPEPTVPPAETGWASPPAPEPAAPFVTPEPVIPEATSPSTAPEPTVSEPAAAPWTVPPAPAPAPTAAAAAPVDPWAPAEPVTPAPEPVPAADAFAMPSAPATDDAQAAPLDAGWTPTGGSVLDEPAAPVEPPPPPAPQPEPSQPYSFRSDDLRSGTDSTAIAAREESFFSQPGVWIGEPPKKDRGTSRFFSIGSKVGTVLLTLVIVVVLLISVGPKLLPYQTFFVRSGSMSPVFETGDMIVLTKVNASDIKERDIITFERPDKPGTLVTHRVIAIETDDSGNRQFQTKGDANGTPDAWRVPATGDGWRYANRIPKLGYVFGYLGTPQARIALLAIPAVLLGILSLIDIWKPNPKTKPAGRR